MTDATSEPGKGDRLRVRPYTLTGGRVRSMIELAIETIVVATNKAGRSRSELRAERRDICGLCEKPTSIVEISAQLRLPLGVVRVLVGDMVTEGLLNTNRLDLSSAASDGRPDQRLLERILNGLQTI